MIIQKFVRAEMLCLWNARGATPHAPGRERLPIGCGSDPVLIVATPLEVELVDGRVRGAAMLGVASDDCGDHGDDPSTDGFWKF